MAGAAHRPDSLLAVEPEGKMSAHVNAPARVTAGGATQEVMAPMCPHPTGTEVDRKRARRLRKSGATYAAIGRALGVHPDTAKNWCTKPYRPPPTGPAHHKWKGDAASPDASRERARTWYVLGPCERCSEPGHDRHHVDGNPYNNAPENVQILCRRCHMEVDGRMERFVEATGGRNYGPQPIKTCVQCGGPARPSRRGLCARCYDRKRRPARGLKPGPKPKT